MGRWERGRGHTTGGKRRPAPGLWQHLKISFRAPRFDEGGHKIAHARLEEVVLNGKLIHADVKLTHPTGGAVSNDEVGQGPLRFQGDHGPVAFRNIRFKKYDNQPLELQNLSYRYYEKSVDEDEEFTPDKIVTPANMVAQGTTHELGLDEVRSNSEFAIVYEGAFQVDHPGTYLFELRSWGGNRLTIDNRLLIDSEKQEASRGTIDLAAGTHTIQVLYYRGSDNGQPALSLRAEGPGIAMHELHAPSPVPADVMNPNTPKLFDPADEPVVMHGFIQGIKRMHPHSAAIGFPSDVHLAVDLNNVAVLKLWKGAFLDMSTMWVGRGGNDLKLNETAAFSLSGAPSLAVLPEENAPWPDSLQADTDYTFHNYQIDENGKV
ncbi:MAG: PA14 domain-containing protein, partial [Balneolaceae bacterium]|nr:PA14 domain-containing protein [Balneolaceae bacterium]